MFSVSRPILTGIVAVVLCTGPALATVTVPTEFREIVADAARIIRGHVTGVRGVVVADRGIESAVSIAVDAVLKGEPADFVSILVPGGVVGRSRSVMVGAPTLRPGDRAVFFLKRDRANSTWQLVGLSMGIYRVQTASSGGVDVINPPPVLGQTADAGAVVRGDVRRRPMGVSEFESLVRVVMAGPATASRSGR
jgi:hypothetical protein